MAKTQQKKKSVSKSPLKHQHKRGRLSSNLSHSPVEKHLNDDDEEMKSLSSSGSSSAFS